MVSIVTNVIIIVDWGTRIVAGYSYYQPMTVGDFISKLAEDAIVRTVMNW